MCDVCCATSAMDEGGAMFQWEQGGPWLRMEARGKGPESQPCEYRIRRKGTTWSRWQATHDLAGVAGRLGVDVKWQFTGPLVRNYLSGRISADQVLHSIAVDQEQMLKEIADTATIYTEFRSDGGATMSSSISSKKVMLTRQATTESYDRTARLLAWLPEEGI